MVAHAALRLRDSTPLLAAGTHIALDIGPEFRIMTKRCNDVSIFEERAEHLGGLGMAESRARQPIAFGDENRLSSARTARALPSSHALREKPKAPNHEAANAFAFKRTVCLYGIMPIA